MQNGREETMTDILKRALVGREEESSEMRKSFDLLLSNHQQSSTVSTDRVCVHTLQFTIATELPRTRRPTTARLGQKTCLSLCSAYKMTKAKSLHPSSLFQVEER